MPYVKFSFSVENELVCPFPIQYETGFEIDRFLPEDRQRLYIMLQEVVRPHNWTDVGSWTLTVDDVLVNIPFWIIKMDEQRFESRYEEKYEYDSYYVLKPFLPFTIEEVSNLEHEEEDEENGEYVIVRQHCSMPTAGVLYDPMIPTSPWHMYNLYELA
jgi:hypothetical protein